MDQKRVLTELIGSLAVVYFAITQDAMVTGLVLAIFMIAMGGTILPMFTLAKMAAGRDEIEEGALDFTMQILGGVLAYALFAYETDAWGTNAWAGEAYASLTVSMRVLTDNFSVGSQSNRIDALRPSPPPTLLPVV